ncbi:MAG: hypothetical protein ACRDQA_26310, partial [Nocardioidaceae bacterium]
MSTVLNLDQTYLHLESGRAEALTVDDDFWERVISGALPLRGWLVAVFEFAAASPPSDGGSSEVHPNGDEVVDFRAGET